MTAPVASKKREKKEKKKSCDFAVDNVVDGVLSSRDPAPGLVKLTKSQLIEVVAGLAGRYHQRSEELQDQQHEAATLGRELESAKKAREEKTSFRRAEFDRLLVAERIKAEQAEAAAQAAPISHNTTVERKPTPKSEMRAETPTANAEGNITPSETPAPAPSSTSDNFFKRTGRFFTNLISSPAKRNTTTEQPQQALGELPANRKRSAPTEVTEPANTTFTPKASHTMPRANPPFNNPAIPDQLDTISEQMEDSTPARRPTNTPARTQNTPRPASVRRSIQQVREEKRRKEAMRDQTPLREWDRTPLPRLPNADSRLQKLNMYNRLKQKMKELQDDEELEDVIERPIKRVKVDELAEIPHRLPGDPKSTFRMPDPDSDGEMEIDEEIEEKANVFEASQAADKEKQGHMQQPTNNGQQPVRGATPQTAAPKPKNPWAAPSPPKQYAQPTVQDASDNWTFPSVGIQQKEDTVAQQPEDYTAADEWAFPSVGEIAPDQTKIEPDSFLGKKFAYGFEAWKLGQGHLVQW